MAAAIARHYELLDEAVRAHAGVRPVEQGEGDSIVAAFCRASDAVLAALDAQRAPAGRDLADGVAAQGADGDPHRRDPAPRRGQLRRRLDRANGEAARHRPRRAGAGVVGDARPGGGRPARPGRAPRPRHPPPQGPRSARARVAAGPSGARVGVPSARVARQRPEQPARLPVDLHRPLRRDRHHRPPRARQPARQPHGSGRGGQDPAGPAGRRRARRSLPRRRVVGRPRRGAGPDVDRVRHQPGRAARRGPRRPPAAGSPGGWPDSGCCSSWTTASTWPTRAPRRRRRSCAAAPRSRSSPRAARR